MSKQVIKRKELITLITVLVTLALLITGTSLFFREKSHKSDKEDNDPVLVEGVIATGKHTDNINPDKNSKQIGSEAFFLKPSADEVLTALREADQQLQKPPENSPIMKVMWPGFFFSLDKNAAGETIVQLDIDESGFGVLLICTVNPDDYPEIRNLKPRQKIWVAGEVTAIDPEGTGNIFINVEYIRFDKGPAAAQ